MLKTEKDRGNFMDWVIGSVVLIVGVSIGVCIGKVLFEPRKQVTMQLNKTSPISKSLRSKRVYMSMKLRRPSKKFKSNVSY